MIIFIYYLFALIVLICASPLLIFKAKARAGLFQKLGILPDGLDVKRPSVWFHAVSVGEFLAIKTLLQKFHLLHPQIKVVVSTTTLTGQNLARETVGDWAEVVYMPFDLPWTTSIWLDKVQPTLFVISETEIWPGLAYQCRKRGISLVIVNGRISPRSYEQYKRFKWFFARVLANFSAFGAQTETEAERYRSLMAPHESEVVVLGNLKLDGLVPHEHAVTLGLREQIGLSTDDLVFIAGSTHEGEESAVIKAFIAIYKEHPKLKLIIAPRHPERFERVYDLIIKSGLMAARLSQQDKFADDTDVLLVDTMGFLTKLYSVAHVAFVGGSLSPIGGHNLMEPYLYGVPVICGPNLYKTRDTANQLKQIDALAIVSTPEMLVQELRFLLLNERERMEMGQRGNQLLSLSRGATDRALSFLDQFLNGQKRKLLSASTELETR
jgi:3-deoxy-D-manno-octulosonic-acid transferase